MERINRIISNHDYQIYLQENWNEENNRPFCNHHFEHLLSVARLTYILLLEDGCPFISREIAYAAGLLHDIGRWYEYQSEADHAQFSAKLALTILTKAGFSEAETLFIRKAIAQHRQKGECEQHRSTLSKALAKADSLSRLCFQCKVRDKCNKLDRQPNREELLY